LGADAFDRVDIVDLEAASEFEDREDRCLRHLAVDAIVVGALDGGGQHPLSYQQRN
jgi:hypothetical protein